MKPISAKAHGVLDYGIGLFLLTSPWLFGFNHVSTGATLTMMIVGIVVLVLSLVTDYPLGFLKIVPFRSHGVIESLGAVFLLVSPKLVGFSRIEDPRNIAIIIAIAWLGVVALTNYSEFQARRPVH